MEKWTWIGRDTIRVWTYQKLANMPRSFLVRKYLKKQQQQQQQQEQQEHQQQQQEQQKKQDETMQIEEDVRTAEEAQPLQLDKESAAVTDNPSTEEVQRTPASPPPIVEKEALKREPFTGKQHRSLTFTFWYQYDRGIEFKHYTEYTFSTCMCRRVCC